MIFSRYQRVILEVEKNRGWTGEIICRIQVLQLVREIESKENNHGRNHGCKGSIHRYQMIFIKEIVIITRSFHDRIYIVSMGMNTKFKVDSHFSNA